MNNRVALLRASAALSALACGTCPAPAYAQSGTPSPAPAQDRAASVDSPRTEIVDPTGTPGTPENDILVVGIRGSVTSAVNKKRNAKQIVDSVVSEDAGKLPDNNVPEALSRITGVQIDRARGQGQQVTIRGLTGVQTTVNGNNTNVGNARSITLADVPAELVKSVDVYKTRTADQVEGSIAGTVNVELRRPLDLKKGWTLAGSARGAYDEFAEKVSPFASVLVANRFDTGIGEIGVLLNGSFTKTFYNETYIESESPDIAAGLNAAGIPAAGSASANLPAQFRRSVIPYRVRYGLEQGYVQRPSVQGAIQWKPMESLDFVFEGGYIGSREKRSVDRLEVLARESGLAFSNIRLMPDGVTVRGITTAPLLPTSPQRTYFDGQYNDLHSDLYTTNFEAHYRSDRAQLDVKAQYNWSSAGNYFVQQILLPVGLTSTTIDFASDQYKGGVPSVTLNGANLSSPGSFLVERFQDNVGISDNKEFATQADLTLTLSEASFLRTLQTGFRFNRRDTERFYGYRDGFPRVAGARPPLTAFPGGDQAVLVGPEVPGVDALKWYRIPGPVVRDRIDDVLGYIRQTDPANAVRFTPDLPLGDLGQTFESVESSFAVYGQINYAFDVLFPVDGSVGVRYVNTFGRTASYNYQVGTPANGNQLVITPSFGRGNYADILPSATALVHFSPKAQLRLAYSTNVQRPSFFDLRPFYTVNANTNPISVDAGNVDLRPQRQHAFDVSAEYYFGRGGIVSLGGYYKKATNFLYFDRVLEDNLARFGLPGVSGFVAQQRNAGDGEFAGVEAQFQSFFDFLPGALRNFGTSLNGTYIAKARVEFPYPERFPGAYDSLNTSKYTANAALFYDTPSFSTRVAFNYRSPYRGNNWNANPPYSWYQDDTYRVDAAVNYTPVSFLTLSLEGTNLAGNDVYRYFGRENLLPLGVRLLARTVQASARFRF